MQSGLRNGEPNLRSVILLSPQEVSYFYLHAFMVVFLGLQNRYPDDCLRLRDRILNSTIGLAYAATHKCGTSVDHQLWRINPVVCKPDGIVLLPLRPLWRREGIHPA